MIDTHPDSFSLEYTCPNCNHKCGYLINEICKDCFSSGLDKKENEK